MKLLIICLFLFFSCLGVLTVSVVSTYWHYEELTIYAERGLLVSRSSEKLMGKVVSVEKGDLILKGDTRVFLVVEFRDSDNMLVHYKMPVDIHPWFSPSEGESISLLKVYANDKGDAIIVLDRVEAAKCGARDGFIGALISGPLMGVCAFGLVLSIIRRRRKGV